MKWKGWALIGSLGMLLASWILFGGVAEAPIVPSTKAINPDSTPSHSFISDSANTSIEIAKDVRPSNILPGSLRRASALSQRVEKGSAKAAFELVQAQGELRDPATILQLSKLIQRCWVQGLMATAERHQDTRKPTEKRPTSPNPGWDTVEGCEGLPAEAAQLHDEWLAELAGSGNAEAMVRFGSQTLWVRDPRTIYREADRYAAFKKQAESYLRTLVEAGDVAALEAAASLRMNPHWREPDPAAAWAYLMVAAWKSSDTRRVQDVEQRLVRMVPDAQRQRAQALSLQINGGAYVD